MAKRLQCGCCGRGFTGEQDAGHDTGYGTCAKCAEWIAERNERQADRMIATLRGGLNEVNRAVFDTFDRELQIAFVGKAIEDGIMEWGPVVSVNRARAQRGR